MSTRTKAELIALLVVAAGFVTILLIHGCAERKLVNRIGDLETELENQVVHTDTFIGENGEIIVEYRTDETTARRLKEANERADRVLSWLERATTERDSTADELAALRDSVARVKAKLRYGMWDVVVDGRRRRVDYFAVRPSTGKTWHKVRSYNPHSFSLTTSETDVTYEGAKPFLWCWWTLALEGNVGANPLDSIVEPDFSIGAHVQLEPTGVPWLAYQVGIAYNGVPTLFAKAVLNWRL